MRSPLDTVSGRGPVLSTQLPRWSSRSLSSRPKPLLTPLLSQARSAMGVLPLFVSVVLAPAIRGSRSAQWLARCAPRGVTSSRFGLVSPCAHDVPD